jgi:hypothetical protein
MIIEERNPRVFGAITGVFLATVFGFVMLVIWQTVGPLKAVATWGEGVGIAWQHRDSTVFEYTRRIEILETTVATINRDLDCVVDGRKQTFFLPTLVREYKAGVMENVWRVAEYPKLFPVGTHCTMHTYASWYPEFSMKNRQVELSPIEFIVMQSSP